MTRTVQYATGRVPVLNVPIEPFVGPDGGLVHCEGVGPDDPLYMPELEYRIDRQRILVDRLAARNCAAVNRRRQLLLETYEAAHRLIKGSEVAS